MNVIKKTNQTVNHDKFFPVLFALVISTLFIGYAPSSIAIGVYAFFAIWKFITSQAKIELTLSLLLPVLIYLLFLATLFWSVDVPNTVKGLERTVTLLVVPLLFLMLPKFSEKQTKLTLSYITYANLGYGLFFLLAATFKFFRTKSLSVFTYHELVQILDLNAIYVSVFYLISLAFLLSKKGKTFFDKITIVFFIGLILLLSSKMIVFVLALILLSYGAFIKKRSYYTNRKIIYGALLGATFTLLISLQVVNRILAEKTTNIEEVIHNEKFNRIYPWTGTSIRLLQARILYEQIEEESIFWNGFGLFASRENLKKRHQDFNTYYGYHSYNYHNQYAQMLSETGIFGLILLIFMLITNFKTAIKSKDFLFISFSLTIPIVFITESFLWVHRGIVFFIFMYCLFNRSEFTYLKKNQE